MAIDRKTAMILRDAGINPDTLPPGTLLDGRPIGEKPLSEIARIERLYGGVIRITIPGEPPGKPRMTQSDRWRKRPATDRYWAWANAVKAATHGCIPPAETVIGLHWTAYFVPPKSWSKKKRMAAIGKLHRKKPDSSNILKGIEDTLWPEADEALADGSYKKRWDWHARLEVEIVTE